MALATFGTLAGRGAVVTGAAAGIGQATALYLAGEGVRVVVSDIDADAGQGVVSEIRGAGGVRRVRGLRHLFRVRRRVP